MTRSSKITKISLQIFVICIFILAALAAINIFLPQNNLVTQTATAQPPASKPIMAIISFLSTFVIYGGLGYAGLYLSKKINFPQCWDTNIATKNKFFKPAIVGIVIGFFFIVIDLLFSQFHELGRLPHPNFPVSIIASLSAAIGEEIIFRLFFISFWVWVIAFLILKQKKEKTVFWIVAIFSALAFSASHIPAMMLLTGIENIQNFPAALLVEIVLLNSTLSIAAAVYFKKYGILAAMSVHFWTDIIWHVLWGLF